MIRDGRAAVYSLMGKLNLLGEINSEKRKSFLFRNYFSLWDSINKNIYNQCMGIGMDYCKMVKYEDLILNPKETIKDAAKFLNVSWTDDFLHHEKHVGKKIIVSDLEWSTEQIRREINKDSLNSWIGRINWDLIKKSLERYPMLKILNYSLLIDNKRF